MLQGVRIAVVVPAHNEAEVIGAFATTLFLKRCCLDDLILECCSCGGMHERCDS